MSFEQLSFELVVDVVGGGVLAGTYLLYHDATLYLDFFLREDRAGRQLEQQRSRL